MRLPPLNTKSPNKIAKTVVFSGINLNYITKDGDLTDSHNLTTEAFPSIKNRALDKEIEGYRGSSHVFFHEKMCMVRDGGFYYDGIYKGNLSLGEKQLIGFGKNILIFPDKKKFDTKNEKLDEISPKISLGTVSLNANKITTTSEFNNLFKVGEKINLYGAGLEKNNVSAVISEVIANGYLLENVSFITASEQKIYAQRDIPLLENICISNNRVWGTVGSTIYASKLGDPSKFYSFDGLSNDSYTLDVLSGGDFTGCISFSSYILLFKEDKIYKLFGSKPSNYQLINVHTRGVKKGCNKSIINIDDGVIFYSPGGFMLYRGGGCEKLSHAFGNANFQNVKAMVCGEIYYFSATLNGKKSLFCYDIEKNIFLNINNVDIIDFVNGSKNPLYLTKDGVFEIGTGEEKSKFSFLFAPFIEGFNGQMSYSSFTIVVNMEEGSHFKVEASLDNAPFYTVLEARDHKRQQFYIPLLPNFTGGIRLRISGFGKFCLKNLIREVSL